MQHLRGEADLQHLTSPLIQIALPFGIVRPGEHDIVYSEGVSSSAFCTAAQRGSFYSFSGNVMDEDKQSNCTRSVWLCAASKEQLFCIAVKSLLHSNGLLQ